MELPKHRCGNIGHTTIKCKVSKDMVCHHCHKPGHLKKACRSKKRGTPPKTGKAIAKAPAPSSVQELRSYLGILTYYGKFLPNLSTTLHPLYELLKKDVPWSWGSAESKAFAASKDMLNFSLTMILNRS